MLRTFLQPDHEEFYRQAFDLAVTHLRLRKVDPTIAQVNPTILYEPPDSLTQALITVLKESFPLAREQLRQQLEAKMLEFDPVSNLTSAFLEGAHLEGADLGDTKLMGAEMKGVYLQEL